MTFTEITNLVESEEFKNKLSKVTPGSDKVFIIPITEKDESGSTLIVPDLGKEKTYQGYVAAVGPGAISLQSGLLIKNQFKPGDRVHYPKFNSYEIEVYGLQMHVSRDSEIFCSF